MIGSTNQIGDEPTLEDLIGTVGIMLDAYNQGKVDRVYIIYNRFVNSMTQAADIETIGATGAGRERRDESPLGLHL